MRGEKWELSILEVSTLLRSFVISEGAWKWGGILEDDMGITVSFKDWRKYSIFYANENDLEEGKLLRLAIKNSWSQ